MDTSTAGLYPSSDPPSDTGAAMRRVPRSRDRRGYRSPVMATALRRATAALLLPLALASPGCLSSSYRVTSDELARIARVAPEQRWQSVRVTRGLLDSEHPPVNAGALRVGPPLVVVPDVFWFHGRTRWVPRFWRSNPGTSSGAVRPGVGGGGRSSGGVGSGSGSGGGGGAEVVAIVAIVVVAAAGIVFVLAGTEYRVARVLTG